MKSLLFVVPALPSPPTTGGEIFNHRLREGLAARFDLTTVTLKDLGLDGSATPDQLASGLQRFAEGHVTPGLVFIDTYLYRIGGPAIERLRALGFGPFVGFGQAWYPGRYRSMLSRFRVRRALAAFLKRCDHHVVVSDALRSDYVRAGIPAASIDTALPGFDLAASLPARAPRRPGPLRVRTAGTYMEAKGQHLLVEAVERLAAHDPNLFTTMTVEAIGPKSQTPEYVRDLESRAAKLPPGLLRLTGSMPQADLWRAFQDTDVFVFPAAGEGLGMVVLEAMLCGAFPVVSPDGPLREIVGEGGDAGRVVPRSADAIARTLRELAASPDLERLREAAYRRALSMAPTWTESIDRVAGGLLRAGHSAAA